MKFRNLISYGSLFIFLLFVSCKSSDPSPPETVEVPISINAEAFAEAIMQKTDLVKSIEHNTTKVIEDGLTYTEISYLDKEGMPVALYILSADLDKGISLAATAATNGENLNAKETVRQQIGYVEDRGYDVLAAVNGDFWRVNANENDNTPMGQVYGLIFMDGNMVKNVTRTSQYYFTALLKNGKFVMGNKETYLRNRTNIQEAIGARFLLVEGGKDVANNISNKDIAPRTSVGRFTEDKILFIVVDGRRPSHSVGLSMQDLGKIYEALGADIALNLDGGGSTTLIIEEGDDFVTKNKPSDNVERNVANAWTIVKK